MADGDRAGVLYSCTTPLELLSLPSTVSCTRLDVSLQSGMLSDAFSALLPYLRDRVGDGVHFVTPCTYMRGYRSLPVRTVLEAAQGMSAATDHEQKCSPR